MECPKPRPDQWGLYDTREIVERAGGVCFEEYFDWKVRLFDTREQLDQFLATKPAEGVTNVQWDEVADPVKKKGRHSK